jgi:hypothetical protein
LLQYHYSTTCIGVAIVVRVKAEVQRAVSIHSLSSTVKSTRAGNSKRGATVGVSPTCVIVERKNTSRVKYA